VFAMDGNKTFLGGLDFAKETDAFKMFGKLHMRASRQDTQISSNLQIQVSIFRCQIWELVLERFRLLMAIRRRNEGSVGASAPRG
jgi:hypothetical protein